MFSPSAVRIRLIIYDGEWGGAGGHGEEEEEKASSATGDAGTESSVHSSHNHILQNHVIYNHICEWSFLGGSVVKNLPLNEGDAGSIPGLGRSLGEGNGYPLEYSCLENPMDRGTWRSQTSEHNWVSTPLHIVLHIRVINNHVPNQGQLIHYLFLSSHCAPKYKVVVSLFILLYDF